MLVIKGFVELIIVNFFIVVKYCLFVESKLKMKIFNLFFWFNFCLNFKLIVLELFSRVFLIFVIFLLFI